MSTSGTHLSEGGNLVAIADLSAAQFCACKQTTTPRAVTLASAGGEAISGIINNTPKAGESVELWFSGYTKAMAGAAGFAAGDKLMTEAGTGRIVTATGSNVVIGVARETCASGQIGLITIVPTAG